MINLLVAHLPARSAFRFILLLLLSLATPSNAEDWIYAVQPGENLWDLADRHLIQPSYAQRLQALNGIADPYHIPPGTRLRIPVRWLKSTPFLARVVDIQGDASLIEQDTGKTEALRDGSLVIIGDTVTTAANASLTLEFTDGSRVLLAENGRLQLERVGLFSDTGMTDTRLKLEKGRAETRVAPREGPATKFEISTPSALTSVRGTDYRIGLAEHDQASRTEVLHGKVLVQAVGVQRLILPGQGTVTETDRPPAPPVPLRPAPATGSLPGMLDRVPVQFALPEIAGSTGYRVQLSASPDFTSLMMDQTVQGQVAKGPDLPDGTYHLRVRAIGERGLEGLNGERTVELNARPEPPFLIEPKPGQGVSDEKPALVWSKPVNIGRFRIQIARQSDFREIVAVADDQPGAEFVPSVKLPLGTYFWRVAAIDDREGAGPFSDPQEFRRVVPAPALDEPDLSGDKLLVRCRAGLPGQKYQFQLADEQGFHKPLIDRVTADPKLELDRPDSGAYYLRVRTVDADGFQNPYGPPQLLKVPSDWVWWLALLPLLALLAL
jgi:hypothetical protein